MSTQALPLRQAVRETTLLRIDDGWEIGLTMVYQGEYLNESGKTVTGPLARLSIWDGKKPRADTLEVHEGSIFEAGRPYRVVEIKEGESSGQPGTSEGYMVIEQTP